MTRTKWLFFFLSDGTLNANSNCVHEDQPEAETTVSREDWHPKDGVEGEKEPLPCDAGPEHSRDATSGPQVSEE